MSWSQRLTQLGIELPAVIPPAAAYVPAVRSGSLVYVAGQVPIVDGTLVATGKVGTDVSPEEAKGLARICGLNLLAAVHDLVGVDSVVRVVRVGGFVAAAEGFTAIPAVINGTSELFGEIFEDAGQHARAAVGVAELPLGAPVEVEALFEVS